MHCQVVYGFVSAMLVGQDVQDVSLGKVSSDHDEEIYKLRIEHGDKFDTTIGYVSLGISFRVASRSMQVARSFDHLLSFRNDSEGLVNVFIQGNVSINL